MNIREAAGQLEKAVRAYTARTPEGAYRVSLAAQRPVYLVGPPGVGKTAVVAQVAARMGIGYAAYSMTHHTRQSAIGLPLIVRRPLGGAERAVTEYTVSEIVAGVWAKAEAGAERGILFLDEINCVSESLMPAMLQLLQYKTFGVHALPRGWVIVCAGNPPRYNRYAHTFDAVTLDRLRVIEVEPDLEAWRRYASGHGVHAAVRSYLALRDEDFYAADGDRIVTARSWTDLSDVMLAMEAAGDAPDAALFGQYLQLPEVAERFALYFRLCAGLGDRLDAMLDGGAPLSMAGLPFDEAVFAATLLAGRLEAQAGRCAEARKSAERLGYFAEGVAREAARDGGVEALCAAQIERLARAAEVRERAGGADEAEISRERSWLSGLRALCAGLRGMGDADALAALRRRADEALEPVGTAEDALCRAFGRAFDFIGGDGVDPNARLIFLNDLRAHEAARRFVERRFRARFDALWSASDPDERLRALSGRTDA